MILPFLAAMALMSPPDDCPKKAEKVVLPIPFVDIQALIRSALNGDDPDETENIVAHVRAQAGTRSRDRADRQETQAAIREAMRDAHKQFEKVGQTRQFIVQNIGPDLMKAFHLDFGGQDVRVNLDIDNLPVRDAIRRIFKETKLDVTFDDDLPKECRVTLKVPNARLSTALDMVTDAAGVNWCTEMRIMGDEPPKAVYRIQKSPAHGVSIFVKTDETGHPKVFSPLIGGSPGTMPDGVQHSTKSLKITSLVTEERSRIKCPHCKGVITVYRPKSKDGQDKNASKPWKYCPFCGKPFNFEE